MGGGGGKLMDEETDVTSQSPETYWIVKKSIETTAAAEFIKSQYYALHKRHRCLVFQKSISRFFDVTNNGPLAANTSQDDEKYHKGYWYREQKKKIGGGFGKLKMYITQVLWNRRLAFGRRLERQLRREEKGERERGKKWRMAQKSGCYRGGRKDLIVLRRCAQTGRVYLDSQKAEGNVPYGCATSNPPPPQTRWWQPKPLERSLCYGDQGCPPHFHSITNSSWEQGGGLRLISTPGYLSSYTIPAVVASAAIDESI